MLGRDYASGTQWLIALAPASALHVEKSGIGRTLLAGQEK